MADEDMSLNEDQLLDSLDDANGDSELMNDVSDSECATNTTVNIK